MSWRWIFYVNLPLGIVALVVIAATLPSSGRRQRRRIDYLGAALLAVALSAIVLVTDLGGATYPWSSPIVAAVGFAMSWLLPEHPMRGRAQGARSAERAHGGWATARRAPMLADACRRSVRIRPPAPRR